MVSYVEMIQWNFEMTLARLPVAARLAHAIVTLIQCAQRSMGTWYISKSAL